jgi:hypothetical protein
MPNLLQRNLDSDQIRWEGTVGAVEGVALEGGFEGMEAEIVAESGSVKTG